MKMYGKNDMVKPATEKRLKKRPAKGGGNGTGPKKSAKDRKLGK